MADEEGDAAEAAAGGCRSDADAASAATAAEAPQVTDTLALRFSGIRQPPVLHPARPRLVCCGVQGLQSTCAGDAGPANNHTRRPRCVADSAAKCRERQRRETARVPRRAGRRRVGSCGSGSGRSGEAGGPAHYVQPQPGGPPHVRAAAAARGGWRQQRQRQGASAAGQRQHRAGDGCSWKRRWSRRREPARTAAGRQPGSRGGSW